MNSQTERIRHSIDAFIQERLQAKLDAIEEGDHDKRRKLEHDYSRENWLENAARRVSQIQLVTHAIKYIHPDARGTSIHHVGSSCPEPWVSSSSAPPVDDVVGNAAALDVFKFLKLETDGIPLLQRAQSSDPAFQAAMSDDVSRASDWCKAFANITRDSGATATHTLAKQLYFPLPDGGYHLLGPLYPTAVMHSLHQHIQHDRFSDEAKAAREARRKKIAHPHGHREHPQLCMRKFGGSKPQNISQLNSERGGVGYLLPSLPPTWKSQGIKPPLHVTTVFSRWMQWGYLKFLTLDLKRYLERLPRERSNIYMRHGRARRVDDIVDALLVRAAAIQQLPSGWSAMAECRLDAAEAYWLDPGRANSDETFAQQRNSGDWPLEIGHRFGNWLNARIGGDRLHVGDDEHHEWKHLLNEAIEAVAEEIDDAR